MQSCFNSYVLQTLCSPAVYNILEQNINLFIIFQTINRTYNDTTKKHKKKAHYFMKQSSKIIRHAFGFIVDKYVLQCTEQAKFVG